MYMVGTPESFPPKRPSRHTYGQRVAATISHAEHDPGASRRAACSRLGSSHDGGHPRPRAKDLAGRRLARRLSHAGQRIAAVPRLRTGGRGLRRRGRGRCRVVAVSGLADLDLRSDAAASPGSDDGRGRAACRLHASSLGRRSSGTAPACRSAPDGQRLDAIRQINMHPAACRAIKPSSAHGLARVRRRSIASETNLRFLEVAAPERCRNFATPRKGRRRARAADRAADRPGSAESSRTGDRGDCRYRCGRAVCSRALRRRRAMRIAARCAAALSPRRMPASFRRASSSPAISSPRARCLARMEGRELRWELAGVVAEQEHARKSRDVNMAAGKTAAAQIDQFEIQRQEVKRQLLAAPPGEPGNQEPCRRHRRGGRSRSDPKACRSAWARFSMKSHRWAQMTAELAISDEEISGVSSGMPVTLRLDSHPERQWSGALRGSIRDR